MPELPEVETIVRDIRPALVGRRIDRVALSHDDILRGVTRRRLLRDIAEGKELGDVTTLRDPDVMKQLEGKVQERQKGED